MTSPRKERRTVVGEASRATTVAMTPSILAVRPASLHACLNCLMSRLRVMAGGELSCRSGGDGRGRAPTRPQTIGRGLSGGWGLVWHPIAIRAGGRCTGIPKLFEVRAPAACHHRPAAAPELGVSRVASPKPL